jgi:hypothetical protein
VLSAILAAVLLVLAALLLIGSDLRMVRSTFGPLLAIAGLFAVVLLLAALAVGVLAGGVTVFVALAALGAAVGFFVSLWRPAPQGR